MPLRKTSNLKLPVTLPPVKAASQRVIRLVETAPECACLHTNGLRCTDCGCVVARDGSPPPKTFYPRGASGGFIIEHELWNGKLHAIEWHFGFEHPDTGEYFAAMPAKMVLDVLDICAILRVRPSWIFARSARWKSRLAMYEVRVRTLDWMLEIYYDKANLEQQEQDAFDDATYSRVRPETREERRIKIRMGHVTAGCTDALCRQLHKPPRPRSRK